MTKKQFFVAMNTPIEKDSKEQRVLEAAFGVGFILGAISAFLISAVIALVALTTR